MSAPVEEYLPISMLNQLEYCERRFYLMHVLGEMEVNAHVLQGSVLHEQAHSGSSEQDGPMEVHRRVYVWSEALGIAGFTDIVEESFAEGRRVICPVEYKKGKMGNWLNDHTQLCAQAMCLEEQLQTPVERGFIFYFGSRRREEVRLDLVLRDITRRAIRRARELIELAHLPSPLEQEKRCRDCSLEPVCLPKEVKYLMGKKS